MHNKLQTRGVVDGSTIDQDIYVRKQSRHRGLWSCERSPILECYTTFLDWCFASLQDLLVHRTPQVQSSRGASCRSFSQILSFLRSIPAIVYNQMIIRISKILYVNSNIIGSKTLRTMMLPWFFWSTPNLSQLSAKWCSRTSVRNQCIQWKELYEGIQETFREWSQLIVIAISGSELKKINIKVFTLVSFFFLE